MTGAATGSCSVFVPHATAGVAVMELGSGSEADLDAALARLLPRDDRYRHRHGPPATGPITSFRSSCRRRSSSPSWMAGRPSDRGRALVLVDTNADNHRAPGSAQLPECTALASDR